MEQKNKAVLWQGTPSHYSNLDGYLFWSLSLIAAVVFLNITDLSSAFPKITLPVTIPDGSPSTSTLSMYLFVKLLILIVPLWKLFSLYITTRNTNYQLTHERLITSTGVLHRTHNELELYRIKDYQIDEPFFQRFFSLGTLVLETSDKSHPRLSLSAIKDPKGIRNVIRERVEILRIQKGVREIDH